MLPEAITNEEIETEAGQVKGDLLEAIDDPMDEYLGAIAERLAQKHGLTDKQTEELTERLAWSVVLLVR